MKQDIYQKMELIIKITDDEAQHLYHSSMHCFYHEQAERFEFTNRGDETSNIMDTFDSSHTMHFCDDNIVNAVILKNYLAAKGISCVILWDMGQMGYAVVTRQLWEDYMKKTSHAKKDDASTEDDVNNESSDEKLEINI